jgi:hypothetical protein
MKNRRRMLVSLTINQFGIFSWRLHNRYHSWPWVLNPRPFILDKKVPHGSRPHEPSVMFSVRGDTHRGMGKLENRYLMKNWPGMLVSLTINQVGVFSWRLHNRYHSWPWVLNPRPFILDKKVPHGSCPHEPSVVFCPWRHAPRHGKVRK